MSVFSSTRFAWPCAATSIVALPTLAVVVTWRRSSRRSSGKDGSPASQAARHDPVFERTLSSTLRTAAMTTSGRQYWM
jgi:hypothetical protein